MVQTYHVVIKNVTRHHYTTQLTIFFVQKLSYISHAFLLYQNA